MFIHFEEGINQDMMEINSNGLEEFIILTIETYDIKMNDDTKTLLIE